MQCDVFVGGSPVALHLKAWKAGVILRQRKKTFIVYECGVTQVLSEKNREVRSWFEVSEIILPPPLLCQQAAGLWNCSYREQSAHSCKSDTLQLQKDSLTFHMTTRFYICDAHCSLYRYKNLQNNIFVSQCKRYIFQKNFRKAVPLINVPPSLPLICAPTVK